MLFAVPENVCGLVGAERTKSGCKSWGGVVADAYGVLEKKQQQQRVEVIFYRLACRLLSRTGFACWVETWREMTLYGVCWAGGT